MKNNILIICGLILSSFFISKDTEAQISSGEISYKITYDWIKLYEHLPFIDKDEIEKYKYSWGDNSTQLKYSKLMFDSVSSRYEDVVNNKAGNNWSHRPDEYIIYRNIKNNESYDFMRLLNKLVLVNDSIVYPKWKIENQMKEIAGHICMSASYNDTIKGNHILAWFALSFPYSYGPERYGGLPGMILEIDVNEGSMVISADKITKIKAIEITKPTHKKKINILTEQAYIEKINSYVKEQLKLEIPYFRSLRY